MGTSGESDGPELHTHCKLCGYPFEHPSEQEVCSVPGACERRRSDPSYRVPTGRLSTIEERVRQYLIEQARRADPDHPFQATVTYGHLCKAIDPEQRYWVAPRYRGIGKTLLHVSTFEHEAGRPLLSALVVLKINHRASDGFAVLGRGLGYDIQSDQENSFWRDQVEEVVRYWTGEGRVTATPDPVDRALAMLAVISEELAEVRRLLSAA